jgi:hypothetical protein
MAYFKSEMTNKMFILFLKLVILKSFFELYPIKIPIYIKGKGVNTLLFPPIMVKIRRFAADRGLY